MGNEKHETIADIVANIRKRAEEVYDIADRIESANKREHEATVEKSSAVGNVAKMREAVDKLLNFLRWEYAQDCPVPRDKLADAIDIGVAALSAPPRNCDKYNTADEAYAGFRKFCDESECSECRFDQNTTTCRLSWLYSEAEKEESK